MRSARNQRRATNGLALVVLALISSTPIFGADINGDGLETILVPFAFTRDTFPGAYDTVWTGRVWLHNGASRTEGVLRGFACPAPCGYYDSGFVGELGQTWMVKHPQYGMLLTPTATAARDLTLSSRMWELTRRAQPRGIDLPIVREGDFFDRPVVFVAVPSGSAVRVAVRAYNPWLIYGMNGPGAQAVGVEVLDADRNVIGSVELRPRWHIAQPEMFLTPGYDAVLDLAELVPRMTLHEQVHIRVSPLPVERQFYVFLSVTDNETQTVSIITAQ